MIITGWCQRCGRVAQIRIRTFTKGGVPTGICRRCEEKQR